MLDKGTHVCYYKHVNKSIEENNVRHIYVKTNNGYGKLVLYDKTLWDYPYIVEHYNHRRSFFTGDYKGGYITNASCHRKEDIRFLRKRPLIDLIVKRKE